MGPAIAGAFIAVLGPDAAVWGSAGIFCLSWINLLRLEEAQPAAREGERTTLLQDAGEGFLALRARPSIAMFVAMTMAHLLVAIAPFEVLAPLIADDDYGSVAIYGWLLATMGAGAVLGAVAGSRLRSRMPGTIAIFALVPFCVMLVALAIAAHCRCYWSRFSLRE